MKIYLFDMKLFATVRVMASSEAEARRILRAEIDGAEVNFGADPRGNPLTGQTSLDDGDTGDLVESDAGEVV